MSTLSLRLPDSLHAKVRELAADEGVSINQFLALAAAEKVSALLTAEYLRERGGAGEPGGVRGRARAGPGRRARPVRPDRVDRLGVGCVTLHDLHLRPAHRETRGGLPLPFEDSLPLRVQDFAGLDLYPELGANLLSHLPVHLEQVEVVHYHSLQDG